MSVGCERECVAVSARQESLVSDAFHATPMRLRFEGGCVMGSLATSARRLA